MPRTASRFMSATAPIAIDRQRRRGRLATVGGRSSTTPSSWRPARPHLFRRLPGVEKKGVFVYRTIEDLERILAYAGNGDPRGGDRRRPAGT